METIPLPKPLLQAIASYLADRPYREVAGLLAEVQAAAQAVPTPNAGPGAQPPAA